MQNAKRKISNEKYRFLDNIATADIAFEAYGKNPPEIFENAVQALTETMVDLASLSDKKCQIVRLNAEQVDDLLYDFLSDLIFLKDTKRFLVKRCEVTINNLLAEVPMHIGTKAGQQLTINNYQLEANCLGEKIDPSRHEFKVDVKAVTMHEFGVKETKDGYKATVVLDV